jgi:prepilin-type N-terminal cleavage/methylation domain-containing protein/prepilin-type processing-associated H-X9-DG protein
MGLMSNRLTMPMKRLQAGFTLVEVIVVIAIVAVLVAMLMPAVNEARVVARAKVCSANLKSQGVALVQYCLDQKDTAFPWGNRFSASRQILIAPYMGYGGATEIGGGFATTDGQLSERSGAKSVENKVAGFRCPEAKFRYNTFGVYYSSDYAMNYTLSCGRPDLIGNPGVWASAWANRRTYGRITTVPSRITFIADGPIYTPLGWGEMTDGADNAANPRWHKYEYCNFLQLDGHVEYIKKGEGGHLFWYDGTSPGPVW